MKQIVVSEQVRKDVAQLLIGMEGVSKVKAGKILVKSFNADKKLNNFLKAKFETGLTLFTNEKTLGKMFDAIEDFDLTDVKRKQAVIIAMRDANVDEDVLAKENELTLKGTLAISKEQQEQLAEKLAEYRRFLKDGLTKGLEKLGLYVGAFETVEVKAAVEA